MTFIYKQLENSLRMLYQCPDLQIDPPIEWPAPYFVLRTRSPPDEVWFSKLAAEVTNDYPRTTIHRMGRYYLGNRILDNNLSHPIALKIWKRDANDMIDQELRFRIKN